MSVPLAAVGGGALGADRSITQLFPKKKSVNVQSTFEICGSNNTVKLSGSVSVSLMKLSSPTWTV
jgi:hypothetical protein